MGSLSFAKTINEKHLGITASSIMTDCEHHGMTYGCTIDCPVLQEHKCDLKDADNKDLYLAMIADLEIK